MGHIHFTTMPLIIRGHIRLINSIVIYIFAIVICCYRLHFEWVIWSILKLRLCSFNGSSKSQLKKNTLRKETSRLLSKEMFLYSIKEISRLREEINRLLSKGISNIYLKVTMEILPKLQFSRFEKFVTRSAFEEL